jgi:hypothetical protein
VNKTSHAHQVVGGRTEVDRSSDLYIASAAANNGKGRNSRYNFDFRVQSVTTYINKNINIFDTK